MARDETALLEAVLLLRSEGKLQREAAAELRISRAHAANLERVGKRADGRWLAWLRERKLTMKHVEAVLSVDRTKADTLLREAIAHAWTVRQLQLAVRAASGARLPDAPHPDADVAHLEVALSEMLGTRVTIRTEAGTSAGDLVLRFTDADTLEGLLDRLGYRAE